MKITINTPCHENWENMAANQQGAFCGACQKNVVDFSKKTLEEIKTFFNERSGNQSVCGRFREKQLQALSFEDFIADFMGWKYIRKAALIVFFVFGWCLFASAQIKERPEDHIMGGIRYIPPDTTRAVKDTVIRKTPEKIIMGEPEQQTQVRPVKQPGRKPKPEPRMMGDVRAEE